MDKEVKSFDETEMYLKNAEKNMEMSFKLIGGMIYNTFFLIAGALEPLVNFFIPKNKEEKDEPF